MRFRILAFTLTLGLGLSIGAAVARGASTGNGQSVDAIGAAREQIAAGNMTAAVSQLQSYVQLHPTDLAARRFLGDLYFRIGEVDRAAVMYESVLQDAPFDKQTHNRLGTVYAEENRVDDAIKEFEAALPGTDSVSDLVELHQRKGDLSAYESRVEGLTRSYPGNTDLLAEYGQLLEVLHQDDRAAGVFLRALDIDPQNLTAINGLGLAYLGMHRYAESIAQFDRCLRIEPMLFQCQNNLGAAQLEDGQWRTAKTSLDKAFRLEPERGETFVNYGYLDDAQGDWQSASAEYGKAIEHYPYLREAYIDLALDYENHQLYVLAQAVLIKGLASVYDDGRLHVLLGEAYEAQGNRIDALTQFRLGERGSDPAAISVAAQRMSALSASSTNPPQ